MKKRLMIALFSALVAATAVMIFVFSAQNADDSGSTSGNVTRWLLGVFHRGFYDLTAREQSELALAWGRWVRKAAHFGEFFLLGLFARMLLHWLPVRRGGLVAFGASALYAVTDEIHQMYVGGRAAMAGDVLIDSAGALCGVLLTALLLSLSGRRRQAAK